MNIGCITRHIYPTDQEIRVKRFCYALSKDNSFFILCPGEFGGAKNEKYVCGEINRFVPIFSGLLGRILFSPLPINPIWSLWLLQALVKKKLDVIIIRDLRLALPATLAARIRGIRVILDLGENYPGMMEIIGKQRIEHHLIRNIWLISKLESLCVRLADQVWVVTEENKKRLLSITKKNEIVVISNYPSYLATCHPLSQQRQYSETGEPIRLIFLGLIDNIRGLDLAIDSIAILSKKMPNIIFDIYGDGVYKKSLEEKVHHMSLENIVFFHGWVESDVIYRVLSEADIGVLLHKNCDLTQSTIPNKLFDYMSVGLPVISTKLKPIQRVLNDSVCGVVVDEDPVIVADVLYNLINNWEERKRFSINGVKSVNEKYSWEAESIKVINGVADTE